MEQTWMTCVTIRADTLNHTSFKPESLLSDKAHLVIRLPAAPESFISAEHKACDKEPQFKKGEKGRKGGKRSH